jgi:cytochrome oxidase Cu insertion factor (SCO1/SenC/PrrC family)
MCLNVGLPSAHRYNESESGAKMKIAVSIIFFVAFFGLSSGQETPSTNPKVPPSIGLEVGQHAPAFALTDQFGHEQSNETLKGSKGTVLLFFRSADW